MTSVLLGVAAWSVTRTPNTQDIGLDRRTVRVGLVPIAGWVVAAREMLPDCGQDAVRQPAAGAGTGEDHRADDRRQFHQGAVFAGGGAPRLA